MFLSADNESDLTRAKTRVPGSFPGSVVLGRTDAGPELAKRNFRTARRQNPKGTDLWIVDLESPRRCDGLPVQRTRNLGEESLQPPKRHPEPPTSDELQRQPGARGQRRPDHVNEGPQRRDPYQQQTKACPRIIGDLPSVHDRNWPSGCAGHRACPLKWRMRCRSLQLSTDPHHTVTKTGFVPSEVGTQDDDGQQSDCESVVLSVLLVGGSRLKKKQATVTSATKRTSALPSHPLTAKVRKPFLPTVAVTLSKGGTKPPSDLLSNTQNKNAHKRNEGTPSFRRRHTNVHTVTKVEGQRQASSTQKGLWLTVLLPLFLSPHPSPQVSQPVHGERKAFVAVSVPLENLSGTVIRVNNGNPTTLSYPSTHPSFLGREGSWPCGSSRLLAQAPNPRERAPPRLTNPAQ